MVSNRYASATDTEVRRTAGGDGRPARAGGGPFAGSGGPWSATRGG